MIIDLEEVAQIIAEIAEEEIAPRYGKLADAEIDTKTSPSDFVTEADRAAERKLAKALGAIHPGAVFIGEEGVAEDPSILSRLDDTGAFWIVDPLDGTRNFVQGRAEFGTIVALIEAGEIRAGWIYAIPGQSMAMGSKGDGSTWRGERVAPVAASDGPFRGYRAIGNLVEPWKSQMIPKLFEAHETEPARCSAYVYIHLLNGVRDFAIYSRLHPWDHAAGVMMLNEINARAAYIGDGAPYMPHPRQGEPLLIAGNASVWEAIRQSLV